MSEKSENFVKRCRETIKEITDPVELQRQLREMVEAEYPVAAPFADGETMLLHEFERRFKKAFCRNIEPQFRQWPVLVRVDTRGNLSAQFGKTLDQITADLAAAESA